MLPIAMALIIVLPLLIFLVWAKMKGRLGNFPGDAGRALSQLQTFVQPTAQHVVETKKQRKKENGLGDDGPPDPSPWSKTE